MLWSAFFCLQASSRAHVFIKGVDEASSGASQITKWNGGALKDSIQDCLHTLTLIIEKMVSKSKNAWGRWLSYADSIVLVDSVQGNV